MSIDPYDPVQDQNPHSPLPAKPDPLGPGQVDTEPGHQSGVRRPPGDGQPAEPDEPA